MLVACGAAQTPQSSPPSRIVESADVPDPADRCLAIPTGCPGSDDVDGCPDLSLSLGDHCELSERDARSFREVSDEMKKERRITSFSIVGSDAQCSEELKKWLIAAGVDGARVSTRVTSARAMTRDVYFEVTAWDGKRCSDGG